MLLSALSSKPSESKIVVMTRKAQVIIYSRPGCCLCQEAKAIIRAAGCDDEFILDEVNIDEDPALREAFRYDVPVIFINGVKAFKHRVDAREFKRKLLRLKDKSASRL
jgi:glutaredoxin